MSIERFAAQLASLLDSKRKDRDKKDNFYSLVAHFKGQLGPPIEEGHQFGYREIESLVKDLFEDQFPLVNGSLEGHTIPDDYVDTQTVSVHGSLRVVFGLYKEDRVVYSILCS